VQIIPDDVVAELTTLHSSSLPSTMQAYAVHSVRSDNQVLSKPGQQGIDRAYFDSYSYFDIHREMLEDQHRTETYRCTAAVHAFRFTV
jgi:hypothetical protein